MAGALQLLRGERYGLPTEQGPQVSGPPPALALINGSAGGPMRQEMAPAPSPLGPPPGAEPMPKPGPMGQEGMGAPEAMEEPRARPGTPEWMTPERKSMYERAKRAAKNYRAAVDKRRMMRKHSKEYSALYNKNEQLLSQIETMDNLLKTYPELYRQDDPRYLNTTRDMTKKFEEAQALQGKMRDFLKRYGVKTGKGTAFPEDPFGESGDDQFDQFIQQGYADAMMSPY